MGTYILRRLLMTIPVLWGIATAVFFLVFAIPGDPADILMGHHPTAAARDSRGALHERLRPAPGAHELSEEGPHRGG